MKHPHSSQVLYDVDYFIYKFSRLTNWCTQKNNIDNDYCALGHCEVVGDYRTCATPESTALINLFATYLPHVVSDNHKLLFKEHPVIIVTGINDGTYEPYKQPTPKQRILAALYDIRELENKGKELPKEQIKTKYVVVKIDNSILENKLNILS